jgi:hypothetical protein
MPKSVKDTPIAIIPVKPKPNPVDSVITISPIEGGSDGIVTIMPIDTRVQSVEDVNSDLSKLLGLLSLLGLISKLSNSSTSDTTTQEGMENLIEQLNYAIESAKIQKAADDLKARNRVFEQSSGL